MEWISVKEALPNDSEDDDYNEYNVYCENNQYHENIVTSLDFTEHGWCDENGKCWNEFVTHWMSLPEPPTQ